MVHKHDQCALKSGHSTDALTYLQELLASLHQSYHLQYCAMHLHSGPLLQHPMLRSKRPLLSHVYLSLQEVGQYESMRANF